MRKLLLICLLLTSIFAKVYTNLDEAKIEARNSFKPIFLIAYSTTCPYCQKYFEDMKNNQDVLNLLNKGYVVGVLNVNKDMIPSEIPYDGTIPFSIVLDFNANPIAPPLKGRIPMNYLIEYLYQSRLLFNQLLQSQLQY